MSVTMGEKIVKLETQMANVASEMAEVKGLVKELIVKVDSQAKLETKITNLEYVVNGLLTAQKDNKRNTAVVGVICSISTAIITFLTIEYLRSAK